MAAPHLGGAPNPEGTLKRDRGCETPLPGDQSPPTGGGHIRRPPPLPAHSERKTLSLSLCQLLGGPETWAPTAAEGWG